MEDKILVNFNENPRAREAMERLIESLEKDLREFWLQRESKHDEQSF